MSCLGFGKWRRHGLDGLSRGKGERKRDFWKGGLERGFWNQEKPEREKKKKTS